jgi:hypothetical protein
MPKTKIVNVQLNKNLNYTSGSENKKRSATILNTTKHYPRKVQQYYRATKYYLKITQHRLLSINIYDSALF